MCILVNIATMSKSKESGVSREDLMVFGSAVAALGLVAFVGSGGGGPSGTRVPLLNLSNTTTTTAATTTAATTAAGTTAAGTTAAGDNSADDNAAFVIGEAMVGHAQTEFSMAKDLSSELRKAKKVVKESAVAKDLSSELRKAKNVVKESFEAFGPASNISKNGHGHTRAPVGGITQRSASKYPSMAQFLFESAYMNTNTVEGTTAPGSIALPMDQVKTQAPPQRNQWHRYHGNKSYANVVQQQLAEQRSRNEQGVTTFSPQVQAFTAYPGYNGYFDFEAPGVRTEKAQANDLGFTSHQFEQPGGGTDSISQNEWQKPGTNWEQVRGELLASVKNICRLFDRLFSEEIFPDAVVTKQDNGQVYIRDGKEGKCIRVDRYYEYVKQSVISQLALGKVEPLTWGRSIELGFTAIETNKDKLRSALTTSCGKDANTSFVISSTGEVKDSNGVAVSISLPWPRDGSMLYDHPMVYKKQE